MNYFLYDFFKGMDLLLAFGVFEKTLNALHDYENMASIYNSLGVNECLCLIGKYHCVLPTSACMLLRDSPSIKILDCYLIECLKCFCSIFLYVLHTIHTYHFYLAMSEKF